MLKKIRALIGNQKPYIHFSIDDVLWALKNITDIEYSSIFEQPMLAFLKSCHEKYGFVVSLYLFYEYDGQCLSDVTDKYREEFAQNSSWLKFGFHAYGEKTSYLKAPLGKAAEDYSLVINETIRITGSSDCIDTMPRLHDFSGTKSSLKEMGNGCHGIVGALAADDNKKGSYYLNGQENDELHRAGKLFDKTLNLTFLKTDLRTERIKDKVIFSELHQAVSQEKGALIVFTHEWAMDKHNEQVIENILQWGIEHDFEFDFPMHRV